MPKAIPFQAQSLLLEEGQDGREIQRLSQQTHLETLAEELRRKMPQG